MESIQRAIDVSLGLDRKVGDEMKDLTIKTPFCEMTFNLSEEDAREIIDFAIKCASNGKKKITPEPIKEAKKETPHTRRVENLFPGFSTAEKKKEEPLQEESLEFPMELHKGFIISKCEECGEIRGFCAKQPISEARCRCGHKTPLDDMRNVYIRCKCGGTYRYKTNIKADTFEYTCLDCGGPVDLIFNKRRNAYETICDE